MPDLNEKQVVEELRSMQGQVEAIQAELADTLASARASVEKLGEADEKKSAKIQHLEQKLEEATSGVKQLQAAVRETSEVEGGVQAKLQARIDKLERDLSLQGFGERPRAVDPVEAAIQRFMESKQLAHCREHERLSTETAVRVGSFWPVNAGAVARPRLADVTTTIATDIVPPARVPEVGLPLRSLRMRDVIPVFDFPEGATEIEYVRITGMYDSASAQSVTTLAVASGLATATVTGHGFRSGYRILISGVTDETALNGFHTITVTGANTFTFPTTAGDTVGAAGTKTCLNATTWGAAAWTAEADLLPEATLTAETVRQGARLIGHWIPATEQILRDDAAMLPRLRQGLQNGLAFKEDEDLLVGSGAGDSITGLLNVAGTQSYAWSEGIVGDTQLDAVRRAATRAYIAEHSPTAIVVSPVDWESMELTKESPGGAYIWASVPGSQVSPVVWRYPVVVTNAIPPATFLLGDFARAAAIWDKGEAELRTGTPNDYFLRMKVAIRATERLAFEVNRPEAFVVGSFDAAPA